MQLAEVPPTAHVLCETIIPQGTSCVADSLHCRRCYLRYASWPLPCCRALPTHPSHLTKPTLLPTLHYLPTHLECQ